MTEPPQAEQKLLDKLKGIILANLQNENFGVDELALESGMSRSRLNRKLLAINKKTIHQFLHETRLQKALELLKNEDITASEVAYLTGFSSPSYFNKCFREFFGYTPGNVKLGGEIQNKNNHKVALSGNIQRRPILAIIKVIFWSTLLTILILLSFYPGLIKLKKTTTENIAIMPFQNMTNDSTKNYWQTLIQEILITKLSESPDELEVGQSRFINEYISIKKLSNYASITPSTARKISKDLDVGILIFGTIMQEGNYIRLNTQIIDSKTNKILRSFPITDYINDESIVTITDSLSVMVKNFLVISKLEKEKPYELEPYKYYKSPEAYEYFILGTNALIRRNDTRTALDLYAKAVARDSDFIYAIIFLSLRYEELGLYLDAKEWSLRAYSKKSLVSIKERSLAEVRYAELFGTPDEMIKCYRQLLDVDNQIPYFYYAIGVQYNSMYKFEKAIPEFRKALDIYKKWGVRPKFIENYTCLMHAYHETKQLKKEKKLFRKTEKDFHDDPALLFRQQAMYAFAKGDSANAYQYVEKYKNALMDLFYSEAAVESSIASLYVQVGIMNEAETSFLKAVLLDPGNSMRINDLAFFLIDKERNIDRGIEITDSLLNLSPDNHILLHTMGWGFYKKSNFPEALPVLQRSWDLRKERAIYDHEAFLHLKLARKAAASQRNFTLF